MPTLNIMAIQDGVRNSGFSSSRPSLILPKRLAARNTEKPRKNAVETTKLQPNQSMILPSTAPATVESPSGARQPHATKASTVPADMPNTAVSILGRV